MPEGAPTYHTETNDAGETVYHCLYCAEQGSEHHSADEAMFIKHMEQRHDGRMVEDTDASAAAKKAPEDHPQEGPPGQTGEHSHGGPPGQTGEPPQGDRPGRLRHRMSNITRSRLRGQERSLCLPPRLLLTALS